LLRQERELCLKIILSNDQEFLPKRKYNFKTLNTKVVKQKKKV
jgi:hypothetical protein